MVFSSLFKRTGRKSGVFEIANKWMPVDQYIGGIEHAILHLLYARSSEVFYDLGLIDLMSYLQLFTQGMICKKDQMETCIKCRSKEMWFRL